MRSFGKLLGPVVLLTSTAYAGVEADRYFEQESFDSIGAMVLEANRETGAVPASRSDQVAECQAQQKELEARMAGLSELLAMTDKRLNVISDRITGSQHKSYRKSLKSLAKQLAKAEKQRLAMRNSVTSYRAMMREKESLDAIAAASAAVLADVEEALAQAEAALAGTIR